MIEIDESEQQYELNLKSQLSFIDQFLGENEFILFKNE